MTPHIIRTVEELEALDPDTALGVWHPALDGGYLILTADEWRAEWITILPALTVVATGEQVRAARKAPEEA